METTDLPNANPLMRPDAGLEIKGDATATLTPLTGRDTEVGLLSDRWEQAQEGMGQVVLIVGEAGLGKSRLVHTLKQLVFAEMKNDSSNSAPVSPVIEWRCSPRHQNTELHPAAEYLARLLDFEHEDSTGARFDRLARHLEDCGLDRPEVVALFARLLFLPPDERYPAPGLTPVREREETFRAVHEWLRACSRRQPILFVIEDVHWIDASSLEFLGQFIAEGLHDRILTVLTFRPEFRTPWPAVAHQTSLALNRLTRRQVAELMRKRAGGRLPDSLVAQIYQRTTGVPLLVEEFIRMARESAIFEQEHTQEIPATLQQLVMARIERIAGNREIVQYAATLGREFQYELLAAVVSVDEATLQAELAKLADAEILFRNGTPPRCAYLFKHALLEEALHNALEETQRRQFHRQVAEVMEARFPLSAENQPELLALHFTEAGLPEKAVIYWLRAGQRSLLRFANIEAIGHLNRGLELLHSMDESDARDTRELELLGPLGTSYIAARGYAAPEVGPIFQRARTLAERSGETTQTFTMMRGHFAYHIVRGDFRLCTDLAEQAMHFARKVGDPGILMEALFLEGLTLLYRGDFAGAYASCARALAEYDDRARTAFWAVHTGEDSGVAHRCYLALACWHLGSPDRALALNQEARELARSLHHPFTLEYALHHTGWLYQHCRLGSLAQSAGEEEMRIATDQGFLFWHASGTLYSGAGLLLRGQTDEGLELFQKGLSAYRATGANLGIPYYLSILGKALTQANRFDEARHVFEEAFALVEKNDERFQEAELHRLRGELHLAESNDESSAAACFRRAIAIARSQQSRAWELRATLSLARILNRQRRGHEALTALSTVFGTFTEGLQTPDLRDAAALLEELQNERMRDDVAAGIRYIDGCIPPPISDADLPVAVDWRYVPSSTLGGDIIGYHWVDPDHFAIYLIDVTGHGMDSALLAVTITNVIRSGSLAGANLRQPDQVLAALNQAFQGAQHGHKYFTIWYGVYHATSRALTYASGGHPSAIVVAPGQSSPLLFPATGPVMGMAPEIQFPAVTESIPPGSRL
ncbi:MAG TPA: SpoIIE family protein phosphatase, partial [Chthoniobacteraceae bacterium]|nr:SpoIIE family protein phosphatase [Chthoniobacteraceae bacterium]